MGILSIGIATFERGYLAEKRLIELNKISIDNQIEIYIIDNNSQDGSYEKLINTSNKINNNKIKLYRNTENKGFSGNFVEVINKANNDYVLWCSDEDLLIAKNLLELINFLKTNKPDILVTNYQIEKFDELIEYRKNSTKKIIAGNLWNDAPHLPGIIFNTRKAKLILNNFKDLSQNYPQLTRYYPQFFIFICLLPLNESWYLDINISKQIDHAEELHPLISGNKFWMLPSRWTQMKEINSFLDHRLSIVKSEYELKQIKIIKNKTNEFIYLLIRYSILNENSELINFFDNGANKYYQDQLIITRFIKYFIILFYNPILVFNKLKIKLKKL